MQTRIEDLHWSDDEDEENQNRNCGEQTGRSEYQSSQYTGRLPDYQRSRLFKGDINLHKPSAVVVSSKIISASTVADYNFPIPIPYLPAHLQNSLGAPALRQLWHEFIVNGADESEMILHKHLEKIFDSMKLSFDLPYSQVIFKGIEADDYIEFKDVANMLVSKNLCQTVGTYCSALPQCCAFQACRVHAKSGHGSAVPEKDYSEDSHAIEVIYNKMVLDLKGNIRIKNVIQFMKEANIPYDKSRIPEQYWKLHGEFLVTSRSQLEELVNTIRTDMDNLDENDGDVYYLPAWLRNEFKQSEIMLFKHHFCMIDVDGEGTVNAEEVMELTASMGSRVTLEQAEALVEEYDLDRSGTIDFIEFMMLVFKIQRGTIDLEGNALAQAMTEAKSQLNIFDEIEEAHRDPPAYTSVIKYGGNPVTMDVGIEGPPNTPYHGGHFVLQVTFQDGYPYRKPDVVMVTRIMAVNILTQVNGSGQLLHLKYLWNSSWSMKHLMAHVVELMTRPDYTLLPYEMNAIVHARMIEYRRVKKEEAQARFAAEQERLRILEEQAKLAEAQRLQELETALAQAKCDENQEDDNGKSIDSKSERKNFGNKRNEWDEYVNNNTDGKIIETEVEPEEVEFSDDGLEDLDARSDSKSHVMSHQSSNKSSSSSKGEKDSFDQQIVAEMDEELPFTLSVEASIYSIDALVPEIITASQTNNTDLLLKRLSRMERLHLDVMFLYLSNSTQFDLAASSMVTKYASAKEEHHTRSHH